MVAKCKQMPIRIPAVFTSDFVSIPPVEQAEEYMWRFVVCQSEELGLVKPAGTRERPVFPEGAVG
jgi:hypothetical protein